MTTDQESVIGKPEPHRGDAENSQRRKVDAKTFAILPPSYVSLQLLEARILCSLKPFHIPALMSRWGSDGHRFQFYPGTPSVE
ncbi:MAG TPA: hypothetical protein VFP11_03660 [Candidatus Angelobacter sp.]|nr:hypothetical protein [Candidatus Angelobacter sp.]